MTEFDKAKSRIFQGVGYPESLQEDFKERIADLRIDALLSPLHDKDANPDHSLKKPHYHLILMWDGPTTSKNAKKIFESIGFVMDPIPVQSLVGASRYLVHMDNPEKYQYKREDVTEFGTISYSETIAKSQLTTRTLREILDYVREENVESYYELVNYAMDNKSDWFEVLTKNYTLFIMNYMKSKSWTRRERATTYIDVNTGQIIEKEK